MKLLLAAAAALAVSAATPAGAQFAGNYQPKFGKGSFSTGVNPQTIIPAPQAAAINRVRAAAGPGQYRPIKTCDTDIAYGTNDDNRPELTSRRRETYIGRIEVYAGGFCPSGSRGKQ
jgi:hypothetical protein